jgi:hypothetical protein
MRLLFISLYFLFVIYIIIYIINCYFFISRRIYKEGVLVRATVILSGLVISDSL